MKYNFKPGDLFVHYKKQSWVFYITGTNPHSDEKIAIHWFYQNNRHSFYEETIIENWIRRGLYHYYPIKE